MKPDQEIPEREQRVADLLTQASVSTRAPDGLRAQVDALRAGPAKQPRATARAAAWAQRLGLRRSSAFALAAAAFLIVLAISSHSAPAPSLAQVAALSGRGPAGPAPGPLPSASTTLLTAAVGDLHFPNWQRQGGWRSSGERADKLGDRAVTTVYYTHGRTRLAYSIVASPTLPSSRLPHYTYVTLEDGSRTTVVWIDKGHTCALTGTGISADSLWNLAKTTLE
jgi:hypothetical protein